MASRNETIETTAAQAAAELARRGVKPSARIRITVDAGEEPVRLRPGLADIAARMRQTAAARGLTTEIFDALLAQT